MVGGKQCGATSIFSSSNSSINSTCSNSSSFLRPCRRMSSAIAAAKRQMIILGRASTISSQVQKTRQPILCAHEIAYFALSLHSLAFLPGRISSAWTHSGATARSSCRMKTPLRSWGSRNEPICRWGKPPSATFLFAQRRMSFSSMSNSARNFITSARISCHTTANVSLMLPSAMSFPPMPTTFIFNFFATSHA